MKNEMNNKYRKLTKNTALFALGTIGSKAISFFLVPLYTNVLTTAEYGIADLILVITWLLFPIFSLHIEESILYYGLKAKSQDEKQNYLKNGIFVAFLGAIALVCLSPLTRLYTSLEGYNTYLIVYILIFMFRTIMLIYTKACERNSIFAIDSIGYAAIVALLNILFLVKFNLGIKGYLLAYAIGEALSLTWLFIYHKGFHIMIKNRIDKEIVKKMVIYSMPLIINSVSWEISSSTDRFMLNGFLTVGAVGIYAAAQKIPTVVHTFANFFLRAWTISAYLEYDGKDNRFYADIFELFSFILVLSISVILLVTKPFMYIYVGTEFRDAYLYVPLLLISALFQIYAAFFGSIIQSGNKNYYMTLSTLTAAIANIVLNYLLIRKLGIQGAAVATALSYMIVFLMRLVFSRRVKSFAIDYYRTVSCIVLLILQAISVIVDFYFIIVSVLTIAAILAINVKCMIKAKSIIKSSKSRSFYT